VLFVGEHSRISLALALGGAVSRFDFGFWILDWAATTWLRTNPSKIKNPKSKIQNPRRESESQTDGRRIELVG